MTWPCQSFRIHQWCIPRQVSGGHPGSCTSCPTHSGYVCLRVATMLVSLNKSIRKEDKEWFNSWVHMVEDMNSKGMNSIHSKKSILCCLIFAPWKGFCGKWHLQIYASNLTDNFDNCKVLKLGLKLVNFHSTKGTIFHPASLPFEKSSPFHSGFIWMLSPVSVQCNIPLMNASFVLVSFPKSSYLCLNFITTSSVCCLSVGSTEVL